MRANNDAADWAGVISTRRLGLVNPVLYATSRPNETTTGFRDVTIGDDGAYEARNGWDACTGLGVPVGRDLADLMSRYLMEPRHGAPASLLRERRHVAG